MRIALACQSYPPMVSGASIVVRQIAEGLSARGHSVLVLAASDIGPGYADTRGGLRVSRLASLHNPMRVGQRFVLWPQRSVTSEFRTFQPQIVHAHDPVGVGLVAIRAARDLCIPIVMTAHQLPWIVSASLPNVPGLRQAVESLLWGYAGWMTRLCDCVVAPTPPIADIVRSRTAACPKIIPYGIDPRRFSPLLASPDEPAMLRAKYGLDADLPVILFVGRIDADKRVDQVVRAAAGVVRSGHAQLLIVGDGSRKQGVIESCRALGILDRTIFPGYIPAEGDLPGIYRLARVLITVSEIETMCLVAVEALSSGVPVVSVRCHVMAQLVQDGVDGFLVPPGDVDAMAKRLALIVEDGPRACRMGQIGRGIATGFTVERMIDAYESLFLALVH